MDPIESLLQLTQQRNPSPGLLEDKSFEVNKNKKPRQEDTQERTKSATSYLNQHCDSSQAVLQTGIGHGSEALPPTVRDPEWKNTGPTLTSSWHRAQWSLQPKYSRPFSA